MHVLIGLALLGLAMTILWIVRPQERTIVVELAPTSSCRYAEVRRVVVETCLLSGAQRVGAVGFQRDNGQLDLLRFEVNCRVMRFTGGVEDIMDIIRTHADVRSVSERS